MNRIFAKILLIVSMVASGFGTISASSAETTNQDSPILDSLESTPGVTIVQPEGLKKRLVKNTPANGDNTSSIQTDSRNNAKNVVYRVEVFADNSRNAKTQATARRHNIQSQFPQYPSLMVFESPFWRVKVGAFTNRSDAEAAMAEIRKAFPSYEPFLRIVRN